MVSLVWGKSRSQRLVGKDSAVPAKTLMKCALKFQMATSAALRRWRRYEFNVEVILGADVLFHVIGNFVVEHVLFGLDTTQE